MGGGGGGGSGGGKEGTGGEGCEGSCVCCLSSAYSYAKLFICGCDGGRGGGVAGTGGAKDGRGGGGGGREGTCWFVAPLPSCWSLLPACLALLLWMLMLGLLEEDEGAAKTDHAKDGFLRILAEVMRSFWEWLL